MISRRSSSGTPIRDFLVPGRNPSGSARYSSRSFSVQLPPAVASALE